MTETVSFTQTPPGPPPAISGPMALVPAFDAIELLPDIAADKMRMLRQRALDAHSLIPEFESLRDAVAARTNAQARLAQLQAHPAQGGWNLAGDDTRVKVQQKLCDALADAATRLQQLTDTRSTAWRSVTHIAQAVEAWLNDGKPANTALEVVEVKLPALLKGETLTDAIGRLRQRGSEIRAELHKIEAAPYPSNHCKAKMRQQIEALSQAGRPDVTMLVAHDGEIAFQTRSLRSKVYGETQLLRELAFAEVPDANALVAWAFKDVLIARLDAEINAVCNDRVALTHETRQLQSAKLQGDLLLIERDECSLTWARKGKVCRSSTVPTSTRSRCSACAWSRRRSSTDAAAPMHVVVPLCTLLLPAMRRDAAIARARSTGGVPG